MFACTAKQHASCSSSALSDTTHADACRALQMRSSSSPSSDPDQQETLVSSSPSIEDAAQLLQSVSQSLLTILDPSQTPTQTHLDPPSGVPASTHAEAIDDVSLAQTSGRDLQNCNGVSAENHDRHNGYQAKNALEGTGAVQSMGEQNLQTQV